MTQYPILLNKEVTSFFGANLNKDSVTAVPSYLMHTPSKDFSIEHDRTKTAGILGLDIAVDLVNSKLLNILALEGYFQSEIGKHYLKLRQTATLDMTLEADGAYYISADVTYTEGQYTNLSFYLDVIANPIVGQKLAEVSLTGGVITLVSVEPAKAIHELDTRFASVVEAIANLASSQGEITSTAPQAITVTPAIMPFTIKTDSTNPEVFAFDDPNDLITFLLNANYNFLSTVSIKSSTNFVATITFRLVNDADDAVILTQQMIADIPTGNTEIFPLNTLLAVGNGVIPDAPLSIRLEVVSDIVGMEIVYFNSILSAGSYVDTYSKLQIDTGIANRRKQYAKETLPRDVVVGDVTDGKATIILTADENLYGRIVISDTTPLTSVAGELLISSDVRDLIVVNKDNVDYKAWRDNGSGVGVGGFITVSAGTSAHAYCDGTDVINFLANMSADLLDGYNLDSNGVPLLKGFNFTGRHASFSGDLDTISFNSVYNFAVVNVTNEPPGMTGWGFIHHYEHTNTGGFAVQVVYSMSENGKIWMRRKATGVFTDWVRIDRTYEVSAITLTLDTNYTLSVPQNQTQRINVTSTGTWSITPQLIVDNIKKEFTVDNSNGVVDLKVWRGSGGFALVSAGQTAYLYCDGTNVEFQQIAGMVIQEVVVTDATDTTATTTTPVNIVNIANTFITKESSLKSKMIVELSAPSVRGVDVGGLLSGYVLEILEDLTAVKTIATYVFDSTQIVSTEKDTYIKTNHSKSQSISFTFSIALASASSDSATIQGTVTPIVATFKEILI